MLLGWRTSTIDVDIKFEPETDAMFGAIPGIKESLRLNVELASPVDFIPVRPGWQDRSPFVAQEGRASFHHFDLSRGLVDQPGAWQYFASIEPQLFRYPALDPKSFRGSMAEIFGPPPSPPSRIPSPRSSVHI